MKFGAAAGVLVLFAVLSCGQEARKFGMAGGAGSTDQGGENTAGSTDQAGENSATSTDQAGENTAGSGSPAGSLGGSPDVVGEGGNPGHGPPDAAAGAAGAADGTMEPPDLCVGKVCDAPPADGCLSGTQFQSYDKTGSCDAGTCSYTPHLVSCTCMGQACSTDPCLGLTCATPPAALCKDPNTVTTYAASGTCSAGSCSYAPVNTACTFGCTQGACKADPCASVTCNTPPGSTCKDTGTRTTYAASGTCTAGTCGYAPTNTACAGATPKCKDFGTSSTCVACLANPDCSNGATCNAAGACVCSARFNGPHCEFQVFRGFGVLAGDTSSGVSNISHDGSVVVGSSSASSGPSHAVRSVNGAALQFIAEPGSLTPSSGCYALAVDSSGTILLSCEDLPFLYTGGSAVPVDLSPISGTIEDISRDGKVLVGLTNSSQSFRKVGSMMSTTLGLLTPDGFCNMFATNGDGSVVVGGTGTGAVRWTAGTGLVAASTLAGSYGGSAKDVSTDGNVMVGYANDIATDVLLAVKWSGAALSPTKLGTGQAFCTNGDGSVSGGWDDLYTPTLWDSAGAHTVKALLGATPDLTGWSLISVLGISDDGKFLVGNGTRGTTSEGWVAHLP